MGEKPEKEYWVLECKDGAHCNCKYCILFVFSSEEKAIVYLTKKEIEGYEANSYSASKLLAKFKKKFSHALLDLTGSGRDFIPVIPLLELA